MLIVTAFRHRENHWKIQNKYFLKYWLADKISEIPLKQRPHRWQHILAILSNTKLQRAGMFTIYRTVIYSKEPSNPSRKDVTTIKFPLKKT